MRVLVVTTAVALLLGASTSFADEAQGPSQLQFSVDLLDRNAATEAEDAELAATVMRGDTLLKAAQKGQFSTLAAAPTLSGDKGQYTIKLNGFSAPVGLLNASQQRAYISTAFTGAQILKDAQQGDFSQYLKAGPMANPPAETFQFSVPMRSQQRSDLQPGYQPAVEGKFVDLGKAYQRLELEAEVADLYAEMAEQAKGLSEADRTRLYYQGEAALAQLVFSFPGYFGENLGMGIDYLSQAKDMLSRELGLQQTPV